MIIKEKQGNLIITKSDTYRIKKVGTDEIYDEAWDVVDFNYEETNIPLKLSEDEIEEE